MKNKVEKEATVILQKKNLCDPRLVSGAGLYGLAVSPDPVIEPEVSLEASPEVATVVCNSELIHISGSNF